MPSAKERQRGGEQCRYHGGQRELTENAQLPLYQADLNLREPQSPSQLFEEAEIRSGIEDCVLAIIEPRAPKFDGAENLHVLTFSRHGNFRWAAHPAPGSMERRILPEAGFVGEDQCPVSRLGFFLRAG